MTQFNQLNSLRSQPPFNAIAVTTSATIASCVNESTVRSTGSSGRYDFAEFQKSDTAETTNSRLNRQRQEVMKRVSLTPLPNRSVVVDLKLIHVSVIEFYWRSISASHNLDMAFNATPNVIKLIRNISA